MRKPYALVSGTTKKSLQMSYGNEEERSENFHLCVRLL